jgi:hypothetical protein
MTGVAHASTVTLGGFLNDPGNAALKSSDLSAPSLVDDYAVAGNVAIHDLTIPEGGSVRFLSTGFAAGGIDPYFSLFTGTGNTATFLGSNFDQAFSTGGDFDLSFALAAGDYTTSIGVFANMSFAENSGSGTLGDGFIGLGVPGYLGDGQYRLEISFPDAAVPEPATWLLALSAATALGLRNRRR